MCKPPVRLLSKGDVLGTLPGQGGRAAARAARGGGGRGHPTEGAAGEHLASASRWREEHREDGSLTSSVERKAPEQEEARKQLVLVLFPQASTSGHSWREEASADEPPARQNKPSLLLQERCVRKVKGTKLSSVL